MLKFDFTKLLTLFDKSSSSSTVFTIGSGSSATPASVNGDHESSVVEDSDEDADDGDEEEKEQEREAEEQEDNLNVIEKVLILTKDIFLPFKIFHGKAKPKEKSHRYLLLVRICRCICCWMCLLLMLIVAWITFYMLYIAPEEPTGFWREFNNLAVVTDVEACAGIGRDIIKAGGTVVDGAISTMLCNGVYSLHRSGLGGGFFMTYYNRSEKKAYVIDALGTAPRGFKKVKKSPRENGELVTVPGELKGYYLAHSKFGKLKWRYLFDPVIELCIQGIEIGPTTAQELNKTRSKLSKMTGFKDIYFKKEDEETIIKEKGDTINLLTLARTLKAISLRGPQEFYEGPLGAAYLQDLKKQGGVMKKNDLSKYRANLRMPTEYKLYPSLFLYTSYFPGSGCFLGSIFGVLDRISSIHFAKPIGLYYTFVEVIKSAFSQWFHSGDPDFRNISLLERKLTLESEIKDVSSFISGITKVYDYYEKNLPETIAVDEGSSSLCIIGVNGDAIAATSTINSMFGAQFLSTSTGINTNNNMKAFSSKVHNFSEEGINNLVQPGKRPRSSLSPSILINEKGDVVLVISAGGGPSALSAITFTVFGLFRLQKNLTDAISALRVHHQLVPELLVCESKIDESLVKKLKSKGHHVVKKNLNHTRVVAIQRTPENKFLASYDPRGEGSAAGS